MITPDDEDYKDTKRLKVHGSLPPTFRELAEWTSKQYGVAVLNIILDTIEPNSLPRLNVVLEWERDERKFRPPPSFSFDANKQREIRKRFASIVGSSLQINLADLLVIFSSFEPVARVEANWRVTDGDLEQLVKTLNCADLWKARRGFEDVTFFFYTDAQAKANEMSGAQGRFAQAYAQLTAPYDEFGYLAKRPIPVRLDSKEKFDSTYKGSWFYYDKGH